jgi:hypothetical protein
MSDPAKAISAVSTARRRSEVWTASTRSDRRRAPSSRAYCLPLQKGDHRANRSRSRLRCLWRSSGSRTRSRSSPTNLRMPETADDRVVRQAAGLHEHSVERARRAAGALRVSLRPHMTEPGPSVDGSEQHRTSTQPRSLRVIGWLRSSPGRGPGGTRLSASSATKGVRWVHVLLAVVTLAGGSGLLRRHGGGIW